MSQSMITRCLPTLSSPQTVWQGLKQEKMAFALLVIFSIGGLLAAVLGWRLIFSPLPLRLSLVGMGIATTLISAALLIVKSGKLLTVEERLEKGLRSWVENAPNDEERNARAEVEKEMLECFKEKTPALLLDSKGLKSLPSEIGLLTHLEELDVFNNELTAMPPEISQLTNLKTLDLGDNPLITLPKEVLQLRHLVELDLSGTKLIKLPSKIRQLTSLKKINLSCNNLITLPAEIGQLSQLTHLDLSHNDLNSLPEEIGTLSSLEGLKLYNNKLKFVPTGITTLKNLKNISITVRHLQAPEVERLKEINKRNESTGGLQIVFKEEK